MTTVPVTDIPGDYAITTFSEDSYPSNKHYEITTGQLSILRTVNDKLLARTNNLLVESEEDDDYSSSPETCQDNKSSPQSVINNNNYQEYVIAEQQRQQRLNITVSGLDTVLEREPVETTTRITSMPSQTPSLGVMFDKDRRIKLLEEEIITLKKQRTTTNSNNLDNFTKILFSKTPHNVKEVNKRVVIVNHANLNNVPLSIEDLENCSDEEIDRMYRTIKQYHENRKRKIVITNAIIIIINILEQVLVKLGFDDIKGLSSDVTSEIIDVEIGDDCEVIADKIGIGNNPIINIALFIVKIFVRRIRII